MLITEDIIQFFKLRESCMLPRWCSGVTLNHETTAPSFLYRKKKKVNVKVKVLKLFCLLKN